MVSMIGLILNSSFMSALHTLSLLVTPFTNISTFISAAVILLLSVFVSIQDSCPYSSIGLVLVMRIRISISWAHIDRLIDDTSFQHCISCYCFSVAKTNAAISLERVTNAQLLCLQAERRRQRRRLFHIRITDRALPSRTLGK